MLANRHGPRRTNPSQQNSTRFTGSQFVNKSLHDAKGGKWQPNDIHVYLVLSVRRVMDTLININRGITKLCMHVYLVLSVRRSVETHIQTQADETNLHAYVYLVLSVRQAMETLVNSSRRKTKLRVRVDTRVFDYLYPCFFFVLFFFLPFILYIFIFIYFSFLYNLYF